MPYSLGNKTENIWAMLRLSGENSRIPGRITILLIDVFPKISTTNVVLKILMRNKMFSFLLSTVPYTYQGLESSEMILI